MHYCSEIYGINNLWNLLLEDVMIKNEDLGIDKEYLIDLVHHEFDILISICLLDYVQ